MRNTEYYVPGIDPSRQEQLIFSGFWDWVQRFAGGPADMQMMLVHRKLYEWYKREFLRAGRMWARDQYIRTLNMAPQVRERMLMERVYMIDRYPKSILRQIRRHVPVENNFRFQN